MKDIATVTYIPPCWCHGSKGYDIEHECFIDPPTKPVYVRINGRKREAKRWLWLWRVVARVQEVQGRQMPIKLKINYKTRKKVTPSRAQQAQKKRWERKHKERRVNDEHID